VVVVLGTTSPREMAYREKYLMKIMDRYGASLPPPLNSPQALTGIFDATLFSFGSTRHVFRMTGDFYINPCADASKDLIKNLHHTALEVMGPYWKNGTLLQFGPAVFFVVYENYSDGAHHEDLYFYDPYDSKCLEGTRELIAQTVDPQGKFRRLTVPCLGGGLQFEPVHHIHQTWGPMYDNYDLWQRRIKAEIDPNGAADWGCYVPPVYP
jgi:glycolate oxidase